MGVRVEHEGIADGAAEIAVLVERARRDPDAFAALYRHYVTPVYRYLYHSTGSVLDAEDLTATTFAKALAALPRYAECDSFAAWLFSIARHTLRDAQRRRRPSVDLAAIADSLADDAPTPEAHAIRGEDGQALRRALRALPADQREAVTLRFFGGLRSAEVARTLGRSEGAVRMLIHRAIATLRTRLAEGDAR